MITIIKNLQLLPEICWAVEAEVSQRSLTEQSEMQHLHRRKSRNERKTILAQSSVREQTANDNIHKDKGRGANAKDNSYTDEKSRRNNSIHMDGKSQKDNITHTDECMKCKNTIYFFAHASNSVAAFSHPNHTSFILGLYKTVL